MARRGMGLAAFGLGLLLAAAAACGPSAPTPTLAVPTPTPQIHRLPNIAWSVAPSLEEQIFRSTVIVRATLQSATAATETVPSAPGVAPTYEAVQELRFTVHEYLKGSGPTTLLVAVRGGHGFLTQAAAREMAEASVRQRVTTWDDREGVLFLRALDDAYTPAGGATGGSTTLGFTAANYDQSPWAYSVDTRSRAWLPAQQAGSGAAAAGTQTYITDGARTPPPTVTLTDLRTRITTMATESKAGTGVAGYERCVLGRILHERHRRAVPWTAPQKKATLASGAAAGTEVYKEANSYGHPQYDRYWLSGPDAARFKAAIVDADNQPSTGYEHRLNTARPLPAGVYRVHYNWQYYTEIPCNFKPNDTYDDFTVTVTAPIGTLHEAFFDPVAIGTGVGAGGNQGALTSTSFSVGTTSTAFQRLVWDAKHIQLDLSTPVALSSYALAVIGPTGVAALQLDFNRATSVALPGGGQAWRWRVCTTTAPWTTGDQLMLRLSSVASASAAPSDPLGCGPAPTFSAARYAFTTAENVAVGAAVGTVKATGQGTDAVTHALTAGNTGGAFAIDARTGSITVAKALDYETTPSYTLTVQAEQPTSAVASASVTITVTDVAETPTRPRR